MADPVTYIGPDARIVRTLATLTDDDDFADPSVPITETDLASGVCWGVPPHRSGGLGPLKQLLMVFIFLDDDENEVAGVTFDFYTYTMIQRNQLAFTKKGATDRPIVRKTGAGTAFNAVEVMTVDVNKCDFMGICLSNFANLGAATHGLIVAQEAEYR